MEDMVTGTEMQKLITLWWDIFSGRASWINEKSRPLPMAVLSTAYLANLICCELKFELADNYLSEQIQKHLLPQLDKMVQVMLVGGYVVIKPYVTRGNKILFDYADSRRFTLLEMDESGNVTEGIFTDYCKYKDREYERREHHLWHDNIHEVKNSVYIKGTEQTVNLESIPRWAQLKSVGSIKSEIPMIITIRTPYANNLDLDSELPVSLYANSVNTLKNIDYAHTAYLGEMKKMEAIIFADESLFVKNADGDAEIIDDLFYKITHEGDSIKFAIEPYAPIPREEHYRNVLNTELRLFEIETGISTGTFTFDAQKGLVTATQVLSEDKTTYNTVKQLQKPLEPALYALAQVAATLAKHYGMSVKAGDPGVEFGDSVFEDTGTEFTRRLQLVEAGLYKGELFNAWYFGVPEDKARKMMSDKRELFDGGE